MRAIFFLFLLANILIFSSCEEEKSSEKVGEIEKIESNYVSDFPFQYNLAKPILTFKLPKKLNEISGLSITEDNQNLLAVNDEQGIYFVIDKQTGEIIEETVFGSVGDYEGIEMVGSAIFAVQNNGIISEASFLKKDSPTVIYKTGLTIDYDVEGLGYNSATNQLLLACKGKAGKGGEFKGKRAIYAFGLDKKELQLSPFSLFEKRKILEKTSTISLKRADKFGYSGIAVHPLTQDIYALSSPGKILAVFNQKGELVHTEDIQNSIFTQPEGICFDKEGQLYISTEGGSKKAEIFVFNRQ